MSILSRKATTDVTERQTKTRCRICVLSDDLSGHLDEGAKKFAVAIGDSLAHRHKVTRISTRGPVGVPGVQWIPASRTFLSRRFRSALQDVQPELLVYAPRQSATLFSFLRARILRSYVPDARIILVGLQTRRHSRWGRSIIRRVRPDLAVVQSPENQAYLASLGCRVALIPSGVDIDRFQPVDVRRKREIRATYGIDDTASVVLHVGHLTAGRGIQTLIDLARNSTRTIVVVTSTSSARDDDLANELLAAGVRLITEYIPNIEELYQLADCYVFPVESTDNAIEAPLSVLEALASGVPVVSTRFGGLPAMFADQADAGLTFVDKSDEIPAAVERSIAQSARDTRRLVLPYSWDTVAEQIVHYASDQAGQNSMLTADLTRLADGGPLPTMPANRTIGEILDWFAKNKYPLMSIAPWAPEWLVQDRQFGEQLDAERAWYVCQRNEYVTVRDAWLRQGISNIMLKSAGNNPSFPHLSDNIDILVRPHDAPRARATLRCLGYAELRNIEEPQKHLFRKFHNGRSISAIHVHEQIGWLVGFMDNDAIWNRMRESPDDPAVIIPSQEDAILINLAHAGYENKELRLVDVMRVRHVLRAANGDIDWAYMQRVAASRGWLDGLRFMLLVYAAFEHDTFGATLIPETRIASWEADLQRVPFIAKQVDAIREQSPAALPLNLGFLFSKRLYYRKILADPSQSLRRRWRDVPFTLLQGVRLKARLRPQRPFVVTLSGIDGSGKTAHARTLVEALQLCELNAEYVWSRGGSTGIVRIVNRLRLHRRSTVNEPSDDAVDTLTRRRRRFSNPFVAFCWAWLVAIEQLWTFNVAVRLRSHLWRILVLDRCVYDTAIEMDLSLPKDARWSRRAIPIMLGLTPRPHRAYVLDVTTEIARTRKADEHWHVDLPVERQRYLALTHEREMTVLSNSGAFEECSDALIRDVMMTYMARVETLPGSLLMINPSQRNRPDPFWTQGGAR